MSAYLVTREGQELGSFEASQIQEGLKTGSFLPSDWCWREGMSSWQGLTELFDAAPTPKTKALSSTFSARVRKSPGAKPPDSLNPYAAPVSNVVIMRTSGELPFDVMLELRGTRPWVLFIAIVMWIIGGGFVLLMLFGLLLGNSTLGNSFDSGGLAKVFSYLIAIGLGYIIIYPTLKLTRYALSIGRLAKSESFTDLAAALSEQRRFWRFQGIVLIANLGFGLLLFIWMLAVR